MKAARFVIYLIVLQMAVYFTMKYLFSLSNPLTAVDTNTFIPLRILMSSALKTSILILHVIFSLCCIYQIWDSIQQAGIRHRKSKTTYRESRPPSMPPLAHATDSSRSTSAVSREPKVQPQANPPY